jgi:hypothetical protein
MAIQAEVYIIYKDESGRENYVFFDVCSSVTHLVQSEASEFVIEDGSVITDHILNRNDLITFQVKTTNNPFPHHPMIPGVYNPTGDFKTVAGDWKNVKLNYPKVEKDRVIIPPLEYPQDKPTLGKVINSLSVAGAVSKATALITGDHKVQMERTKGKAIENKDYEKPEIQMWVPQKAERRAQDMFNLLRKIQLKNYRCDIVTKEIVYRNMVLVELSSPKTQQTGESMTFDITAKEIRTAELMRVDNPIPKEILAQSRVQVGSKNGVPIGAKADALARQNTKMIPIDGQRRN